MALKPFNELKKHHRRILRIRENKSRPSDEILLSHEEQFKKAMVLLLDDHGFMDNLNRLEILQLLDWCNRYQPVPPYTLLGSFSGVVGRIEERKLVKVDKVAG